MVPAMSICAHLTGAALSFVDSIPSTNDFRKSAAVQAPAGFPPVCRNTDRTRTHDSHTGSLTLHKSALDEYIWGPYSSSSGSLQNRSCSAKPAASSSLQRESEVCMLQSIDYMSSFPTLSKLTEKTPV